LYYSPLRPRHFLYLKKARYGSLFLFRQRLYALGAGFDFFSGKILKKFRCRISWHQNFLQIREFSDFWAGIISWHQLVVSACHNRPFAAYFANSGHIFLFSFIQFYIIVKKNNIGKGKCNLSTGIAPLLNPLRSFLFT